MMKWIWSNKLILSFVVLCFVLVSVYGKEVTLHEPLINDFPPIKLTPNNKTFVENKKCNCIFNFDSSAYPGELFFHLHIPKTGGSTFAQCLMCWKDSALYFSKKETGKHTCDAVNMRLLQNLIQSGRKQIISCEIQERGQLSSFLGNLKLPKVRILTFIRDPMDHLFSAIMHFLLQNPTQRPCNNFHEIIEADADPSAIACPRYKLINMQTTAMSVTQDANITEAINFMSKNVFHFGITRFYRTSLCLLAYQLGLLSIHVKVCDCSRFSNTEMRRINDHSKRKNHSIVSSAKILSDDDLTILKAKYINLDRVLYDVSFRLFLERVMIAEKDEGMSLLCTHTDGGDVVAMKSSIRDPHWYGIFDESN